jgi:hypothetical protein
VRVAFGGITTTIADAVSGVNSRTVLRIKESPRTRAKALGSPSRVENPAASTTIRSVGREANIAIMPG